MQRRRFVFWVGFGLFNLGEKLNLTGLDRLAAATMRFGETSDSEAEHWTTRQNRTWRWFERENLVDGQWKVTGITTPVHKRTGERFTGHTGYLADDLVPTALRTRSESVVEQTSAESELPEPDNGPIEPAPHLPDPARRARHGRPPSRWLRSLNADELRVWLKTIDVPEAGVSGMTYWTHLTRDHSFDPQKITGLNEDEQAKLHAAAHHGY